MIIGTPRHWRRIHAILMESIEKTQQYRDYLLEQVSMCQAMYRAGIPKSDIACYPH